MELIFLSLYSGSLFLILTTIAPILLRTNEHKNLAGRFYGKVLWRFYKIAFLLLVLYLILGRKWWGAVLLAGLGINVLISMWLRNYKRNLGNIEALPFSSPERTLFRRVSYLSSFILLTNFLISTIILLKEAK